MSVERKEVLEYRRKFEVEPDTFPYSTNTETQKKMFFLAWRVCVSDCVYEKFVDNIS